jgi:hypothetical protein
MPSILVRLRSLLGGSSGDEAVDEEAAVEQVQQEIDDERIKDIVRVTDVDDSGDEDGPRLWR